jgi:hypothetical protein
MLDPFISYKEKIIAHLAQIDPLPLHNSEKGKDFNSRGEDGGGTV